uniref:Queuosine 5'-phosphate N-glycosylase/hydrolase n=1 Tax=Tetradesmus obliquus TaxID=3088 RepID=A0A383VZK3_TETOB
MTLPVRRSALWVAEQATHVKIDRSAVNAAAQRIVDSVADIWHNAAGFDTELHFCDRGPLTVQYLLVVDALNFCFWPDGELEYEHLAGGIKASVLKDPSCISAARLAEINGPGVQQLLGWHRELPEQEERARLLREVGAGLLQHFKGQAAELVAAAGQSAVALVQLLTAHFPGFRDHSIYKGRQVFFYKRAQIFVGDVYGAFGGSGLGCFDDIDQLTMFADYRVPVVLRLMGLLQYSTDLQQQVGIAVCQTIIGFERSWPCCWPLVPVVLRLMELLKYSTDLQQQVEAKQEVASGSEAEVELRAASIVAVELLKDAANAQLQQRQQQGEQQQQQQQQQQQRDAASKEQQPAEGAPQLLSIQLDWWLWSEGERMRTQHPPHHRTRTIYY